jgi:hypothetical protein
MKSLFGVNISLIGLIMVIYLYIWKFHADLDVNIGLQMNTELEI